MIHVTYHRKHHRITVTGHALSGEKGHDLVCAAASALTLTAAANVAGFVNQGNGRDQVLKLNEGDAEISCVPVHRMKNVATLIMDTIATGYELLQAHYPENLEYQCFE